MQGSQVEEVETAPHEEGSIIGTSDEGVFVDRELDIVMPEVRENSAGIREGFRRLDAENLTTIFETRANVLKMVATFLEGPLSQCNGHCTLGGQQWRRVPLRQRVEIVLAQDASLSKAQRGVDQWSQGRWSELIRASERDAEEAAARGDESTTSKDGQHELR